MHAAGKKLRHAATINVRAGALPLPGSTLGASHGSRAALVGAAAASRKSPPGIPSRKPPLEGEASLACSSNLGGEDSLSTFLLTSQQQAEQQQQSGLQPGRKPLEHLPARPLTQASAVAQQGGCDLGVRTAEDPAGSSYREALLRGASGLVAEGSNSFGTAAVEAQQEGGRASRLQRGWAPQRAALPPQQQVMRRPPTQADGRPPTQGMGSPPAATSQALVGSCSPKSLATVRELMSPRVRQNPASRFGPAMKWLVGSPPPMDSLHPTQ